MDMFSCLHNDGGTDSIRVRNDCMAIAGEFLIKLRGAVFLINNIITVFCYINISDILRLCFLL